MVTRLSILMDFFINNTYDIATVTPSEYITPWSGLSPTPKTMYATMYATPSNADILLTAIAAVKLSDPVQFHRSVHKWLSTRQPTHRPTYLQLPCSPTDATFAVDRFLSHAPQGYSMARPNCDINRVLHRYLSSAVTEIKGQLKSGHVTPVMNMWRFALDECLKRYGSTKKNKSRRPLLNAGLCQRLDILVVKIPTRGGGILVGECERLYVHTLHPPY